MKAVQLAVIALQGQIRLACGAKAAPVAASAPAAAITAPGSDKDNLALKQAAEAADSAAGATKQAKAPSTEAAATDVQKAKPAH